MNGYDICPPQIGTRQKISVHKKKKNLIIDYLILEVDLGPNRHLGHRKSDGAGCRRERLPRPLTPGMVGSRPGQSVPTPADVHRLPHRSHDDLWFGLRRGVDNP
jgi:hypothetical protein